MKESLCVLTFFLLLNTSFAQDYHYQNCSVPKTCGGVNISYPFFISEQQPSFCGFPGFNLSCNHSRPIMKLTGMDYIVHNINYDDKTLQVSNAAFSDSNTGVCIPLIKPLNLPNDQYRLAENQTELNLLYNCNMSVADEDPSVSKYKVGCFPDPTNVFRNVTYSVLALPGEVFDNVSTECGPRYIQVVVAAPVIGYDKNFGSEKEPALDVLQRGFILRWIATNCAACENNGGKCGFNYTTYHFSCFCPDSPYLDSCKGHKLGLKLKLIIGLAIFGGLLVLLGGLCIWKRSLVSSHCFWKSRENHALDIDSEVPVIDLRTIVAATENFSLAKKLGQGGFGPVYKGVLDGNEVAIKRLLGTSRQGHTEFMNELKIIVRLQHNNLVKLLGCCTEEGERMLVYEFMPKGSLDSIVFDPSENVKLDWGTRLRIIEGIAQGLLYLHMHSRVKIIHRDIKAANILLDNMMTPKISDFGLAKEFQNNQIEDNTSHIAGTRGYMSPEYIGSGEYSDKSDVFAFGVLLLEILSGHRSTSHVLGGPIASWAWDHCNNGRGEEVIASCIRSTCQLSQAMRCVEIAFCCVQDDKDDRPTMSSVLHMIQSDESTPLLPYKPPRGYSAPSSPAIASTSSPVPSISKNEITVTLPQGR